MPDRVFTLPELQYGEHLNVGEELLDRNLDAGRADRPAVVFGDDVLTYGELARRVDRLANGFRAFGLEAGDRLLLRLPNGPEFVVAWLAAQKAGIVTVATATLLRARELAYLVHDCGIRAAVVWGSLRGEMERAPGCGAVRLIVCGESTAGDTTLDGLADGQPERFRPASTRRDDVALIAYTSGSTGIPNGCVNFHGDVLASADTYARHVLQPSPEDRFGGHPSLGFTYGLGGLLVFPLRFGATAVLSGTFSNPEALLEALSRQRVTIAFCSPTSYRLMLTVPDIRARYDLSRLRFGVSAAEPLPASTWQGWRDATGTDLVDGLGATEMFHIFLSAVPGRVRPGSTGTPVPGYDCRVVDDAGRELPRGTVGLIAVKGPTGCKYWNKPDRQADYVRHRGWNVTGDLVRQDADGSFVFQCRSDDMIVSGGHKIAGPEIEQILDEHPAVVESGVVAAPDPTRGHVVKAYVVLKPGYPLSPDLAAELQEHCARELAPYKGPRLVEFVERLPRTPTGKIRRADLRAQAAAESAAPAAHAAVER